MRFWDKSEFNNWPPGISNGMASCCVKCNQRPLFDFQVTDESWHRVVPKDLRPSVICLTCFDKMAKDSGIDACQHLREVQFPGCQSTAVLVPALVVTR